MESDEEPQVGCAVIGSSLGVDTETLSTPGSVSPENLTSTFTVVVADSPMHGGEVKLSTQSRYVDPPCSPTRRTEFEVELEGGESKVERHCDSSISIEQPGNLPSLWTSTLEHNGGDKTLVLDVKGHHPDPSLSLYD